MPLDQSFVGRTYPPTAPYEVGREKIREFAEAIGDANPAHTDPAAAKALGHPDVIAPPTFIFLIIHQAAKRVLEDPELGLEFSRVVHGDQKFAYTRPVHVGDQLSVTATIEDIKESGGSGFITVRTDVRDANNLPVVSATMMLVARASEEG
ncbi:MaoC family dehydratase N-terminal domain-containing protein [Streptantibioticus rubrisoli]|uniref:UPF0336 protein NON19_23210 n=1 Tax=Streptantibioticus rubrisoli TaxID=1387313 RepID=A0ABT1PHM1_9ACTN|nr:MaoC family dehydratase N-terminal domain-containing protein [Streptantibioticus rubrisoli]MCQ4044857.1 MaoC family dehydratase N-terminal domain-containing protein [Streptantibioticus rubrisoli]